MELTNDEIEKLLSDLVGYANGLERVMARHELEVNEVEELALDHNVERCPGCDWFFNSHELTAVGNDFLCRDCAPNEDTP